MTVVTAAVSTALPRVAPAQLPVPIPAPLLNGGGINDWVTTLSNEAATPRDREEAARRLIARQTPETDAAVRAALENFGSAGAQVAVATALGDDTTPDAQLIAPLFALLGPNRAATTAAASALGMYKDDPGVLQRLSTEALNKARPEHVRIAVIRAMGAIPSKRSARTLCEQIFFPEDESLPVRNVAADALIEMTGLSENERDAQRWRQWWQSVSDLSESDFRARIISSRAARYDETRRQLNRLVDELQALLGAQYQATPEPLKPDMIQRFLKSEQAVVRGVGARIIYDDAINGVTTPSPVVRQLLRGMIGDSDAKVRLEVARTIRATNDPEALAALLQQLVIEPQADVRVAIVQAVQSIADAGAIPILIERLNDPSDRVVEAVADALGAIGQTLRERDRATYERIGRALLPLVDGRAAQSGAADLRAAVARALSRVADLNMLPTFQKLLQRREPAPVRMQAFRGLGALAEPGAADVIVNFLLDEREASVRLEGVKALGLLAKPVHAPVLLKLLDAAEPDPSVRQWAWNAFLNVLNDPDADEVQLAQWDQRFINEPERRVPILEALIKKLVARNDERQLAFKRQALGEVDEKLGRFDKAAANQRLALDYFLAKNENQEALVATNGLIRALLRDRKYVDATQFASESIRRDVSQQQTMGAALRQEAERLREAGELQSALGLITSVEQMTPTLAAQYLEPLRQMATDLRARLPSTTPSETPSSVTPVTPVIPVTPVTP